MAQRPVQRVHDDCIRTKLVILYFNMKLAIYFAVATLFLPDRKPWNVKTITVTMTTSTKVDVVCVSGQGNDISKGNREGRFCYLLTRLCIDGENFSSAVKKKYYLLSTIFFKHWTTSVRSYERCHRTFCHRH